jgi:hypothetical protein
MRQTRKLAWKFPLNTKMKIFAFLFKENYSMYELFSGTRTVGYYGESQPFSIDEQTNNLSLGINLIQVPGTGNDTDEEGTDTDEEDTDTSGEDTDTGGEDITDDNETVDNETEEEEVVVDLTLLAHYKFEGDLTDNTSYGRHLTNYPTGFTFSNPDNISGKAAWFSGNKYAYTDNISIEDTDNYTIAFWIKPYSASMTAWDSVMSSGDQTSYGRFQIDYSGQDKLRFLTQGHTISIDLEALEWQHFVFTKQFIPNYVMTYNHVLSYYKDGEYLDNKTQVETRWDKIKIGLNRSGGRYWIGFIDDFRIYNRTLTADEVEELYESYE